MHSKALGRVDVVGPFDERTPEVVLQRLRPEAALLATWSGQAVVLPSLEGRSTTQLMKEASESP